MRAPAKWAKPAVASEAELGAATCAFLQPTARRHHDARGDLDRPGVDERLIRQLGLSGFLRISVTANTLDVSRAARAEQLALRR